MRPVYLALPFLLLAACSNGDMSTMAPRHVPSTGLATSDLEGTFSVRGERGNDRLSATAFFTNKKTGDLVYLADGDAVYVDGQALASKFTFDILAAERSRKPAGELFVFELRRGTERISVNVAAIAPIEVTSPVPAADLRLGAPLTVTWSARSEATIDAVLMGGCVAVHGRTADSGSLVLDVAQLPNIPDNGKGESTPGYNPDNPNGDKPCFRDATLSLVRTREDARTTTLATTRTVAEETHRIPLHLHE